MTCEHFLKFSVFFFILFVCDHSTKIEFDDRIKKNNFCFQVFQLVIVRSIEKTNLFCVSFDGNHFEYDYNNLKSMSLNCLIQVRQVMQLIFRECQNLFN